MLFLDCAWPVAAHCLARLCCLPSPCHTPPQRQENYGLRIARSSSASRHGRSIPFEFRVRLPLTPATRWTRSCRAYGRPGRTLGACAPSTLSSFAMMTLRRQWLRDEGDCGAAEREAWMDGCRCARCNGTGSGQLSESVSVCSEEKEEETVLHKQGRA